MTYEAGENVLRRRPPDANVAAFHSSYKDFQARVSEVLNPESPTPTFSFPVLNAAEMEINGFEFEGVALLGESTRLSGQVSWMDASYKSFEDLRTTDPSNPAYDPTLHEHVPFSPEWTARVALQHTFELGGNGAMTVGGDVAYRGDTWLSVDNRPGLMQDAYTTAGAFAVWDSPQYAWQVRAGVRNLTDELYKVRPEFSWWPTSRPVLRAAQLVPDGASQLPLTFPCGTGLGQRNRRSRARVGVSMRGTGGSGPAAAACGE